MTFIIESVTPADLPAVVEMLREFAAFERLEDTVEITSEKLEAAVFGTDGYVECLIARSDGGPAAYAIFFPYFATFRGQKGYFLEDLYVRHQFRGTGLGRDMLKAVARHAAERGAVRLDFQVLDWNTPAIEFYKRFGAAGSSDEIHFKFTDEAFRKLVLS